MSAELDHNHVVDVLSLYALGALEPAEMQAIADYLQQHPDLQERLAQVEAQLLRLAQSAPPAPLPPTARARLLARVQADVEAAAQQAAAQPASIKTIYRNPLLRPRRGRVQRSDPITAPPHLPSPSPSWGARFGWLAATVVLLFALLLLNRIGLLNREVNRLTAEVTTLRQQNQQLETQWRANQNQLALFLNAERTVALAGTPLAPAAQGAFYLNNADGVIVLRGLDPLPADRTYQLWLVPPDGVPTSVALLPVGANGLFTQTVSVPPTLRNFAIVDVSIEQAGGSPAITKETIVLRGVLQ